VSPGIQMVSVENMVPIFVDEGLLHAWRSVKRDIRMVAAEPTAKITVVRVRFAPLTACRAIQMASAETMGQIGVVGD